MHVEHSTNRPGQAKKPRELVKLGQRIRKLRMAAGFSQEAFAYEIGIHPNYESGIERGERNLGYINLVKIANGLRVPLSDLLDFEKPVTPGLFPPLRQPR